MTQLITYIGRFAPSPSGPLHAGSLVAAVASYLDARAHHGRWLLRIEDVDEGRSAAGAAEAMLALLPALGMAWDGDVLWQSRRTARYQRVADSLLLAGHAYPCGCNRREIADSRLGVGPDGAAIYPGTCRHGLGPGRSMRSLRLRVPDPAAGAAGAADAADAADAGRAAAAGDAGAIAAADVDTGAASSAAAGEADVIRYVDRLAGPQSQALASASGDFVLKRADGFFAYQLAVVVDDADQGVTDVVRGADLRDSTPRQIYLQHLLGVPTPRYLHVPVLRDADGNKLSKQTGAPAVVAADAAQALQALRHAARALDLGDIAGDSLAQFWRAAIPAWAAWLAARGAA